MTRRTFIIAEAGVNHGGNSHTACDLIHAAKNAGADAVKFQLFSAEKLGRPELKELELSSAEIALLKGDCEDAGIEFLCTPFDSDALRFLVDLGVKRIKVSSGMLTDHAFLHEVRDTGLPVILSTGMAMQADIAAAVAALGHHFPAEYKAPITLLHCTSAYPCPDADANLRAMTSHLAWQWGTRCDIGYSDHTEGIVAPIAAVALGAQVIEKHLTLDKSAKGPDHIASIEPAEFLEMVDAIRRVETMLGDGIKKYEPSEAAAMKVWRDQR